MKCPDWNVWSDLFVDMFFAIVEVTHVLSEEGFVCVLHNEAFEHSLAVRRAAHGKLYHVQKLTIMFLKPMNDVAENLAVLFALTVEANTCRMPLICFVLIKASTIS